MQNQIITTKYGKLSGVIEQGITVYKGIPYAKPPIGDLRWRAPEDPEPWEGVRECIAYGHRAMQYDQKSSVFEPYIRDFYYMGYPESSEDCLYLNVAVDEDIEDDKKPVYMWFHGGGLNAGHSYEIEFDPAVLAKKGVIVVSVGQRLNIFGFLALPQLSEEQGGISGNYGLMDEYKALLWVRENIAAFGGDPDNITVGGQSGGTVKCAALAACPKTKGMIRRVINESFLCWLRDFFTLEEGEQDGVRYLESLGLDKDISPEELRKIDAKFFVQPAIVNGVKRRVGTLYCDGVWVPEVKLSDAMDRYAGNIDYLSGVNVGEVPMSFGNGLAGPEKVASRAQFESELKALIGEELYEKYDAGNLFGVTDENAHRVSRKAAAEGLSGRGFTGGVMTNRIFGAYRAEKFPEARNYSYLFSRVAPGIPEDKGTLRDPEVLLSWHSSELYYTFGSLRENVPPCRKWEAYDFELADIMTSYWSNFMKTGDPNADGLPFWPESRDNYGYIELGDEIIPHEGLESPKDRLYYEFHWKNPVLPKK